MHPTSINCYCLVDTKYINDHQRFVLQYSTRCRLLLYYTLWIGISNTVRERFVEILVFLLFAFIACRLTQYASGDDFCFLKWIINQSNSFLWSKSDNGQTIFSEDLEKMKEYCRTIKLTAILWIYIFKKVWDISIIILVIMCLFVLTALQYKER